MRERREKREYRREKRRGNREERREKREEAPREADRGPQMRPPEVPREGPTLFFAIPPLVGPLAVSFGDHLGTSPRLKSTQLMFPMFFLFFVGCGEGVFPKDSITLARG